jgi:hypothetical protein
MTYSESATLATDPAFRQRIAIATLEAAVSIMNDAATAGFEIYYTKRISLAQQIIRDPSHPLEAMVEAVALNPAIASAGAAAPDGDIAFVITSTWDALAGVLHDERPV